MPPRPAPGADEVPHRRDEGRQADRDAPADAARRRRLRLVRRRDHLLHRRAPDRDLRACRATGSRLRASSPTSRRAAPSAATARRSRASARRCSSTRSPSGWGWIRPSCGCDIVGEAGHADRELAARRHDRARRVHPSGRRPRRTGTRSTGSCRTAAASASRAASYISRRRAADLLEQDAAVGRAAQARPLRPGDRRSAARPRSGRARTTCWRRSSPRCSASTPFDVRVVTGDTDLTPVDLGSYSSRVTVHDGQRRDPGGRARAGRWWREAVAERSSKCRRSGSCFAGGRVFDAEDPAKGMSIRARRSSSPRRSSARSARSARTRRRDPPARYKGGGVGPSPAYSYTACVVEVEVDGDRLDHGAEDLDRARHRPRDQPGARRAARWRAASTWGSARR